MYAGAGFECPQCEYVRSDHEEAPGWQCPGCGRAYAKMHKGSSDQPESSSDSVAPPAASPQPEKERVTLADWWRSLPVSRQLVIVGAACFVAGFFSGREYFRYELASAFTDAAEEFSKGLGSLFDQDSPTLGSVAPPPEKVEKPQKIEPITASMTKKGFRDGIQDFVTFTLEFQNTEGKGVRAFSGDVVVTDILDNVIMRLSVNITDPIGPFGLLNWSGEMNYNQFLDRHRKLNNADLVDLKTSFETTKVLYQDGQTKTWGD